MLSPHQEMSEGGQVDYLCDTILGTVPDAYDHPRHGPVGLHIMYKAL